MDKDFMEDLDFSKRWHGCNGTDKHFYSMQSSLYAERVAKTGLWN